MKSIKTLFAAAILAGLFVTAQVQAASAPPLTKVEVYAVVSSDCNVELTSYQQQTTTCDHGGALLRVFVREIGYSNDATRHAWMRGNELPRSAIVSTTPICWIGTTYFLPCPVGVSVNGFIYEYKLDGYQVGYFTYQNQSINAPWNTMSTQILIW